MHSSPFRYFGHHRRVSNNVFSKLLTLLRILDGCEQPGMQWTGGRGVLLRTTKKAENLSYVPILLVFMTSKLYNIVYNV
jgi:hypothetical protein